MDNVLKSNYKNKRVLITGGNGFIGANLTEKLLKFGSIVTIFSKDVYDGWEKDFYIDGKTNIITGDITSKTNIENAIVNQDYIFHLAGISGAAESNLRAKIDMEVNCGGALTLLEACRNINPNAHILFPSSQLVYGKPKYLPVDEKHPTEPTSIYGTHKLTIDKYSQLYNKIFGLKTVVLRIPNPYGPRQSMNHTYGIVNYFIGRTLNNKPICIYGQGNQLRDYIFIDDLIAAMLLANSDIRAAGNIYNVGSNRPIPFLEMAKTIVEVAEKGTIQHVACPDEVTKSEVGDIYLGIDKISNGLNWEPATKLEEGIKKTIIWYENHQ